MVERCVTSLDHTLDAQREFAEALALQSACLEILAEVQPCARRSPTPAAAAPADPQGAAARSEEPRVLLLDGIVTMSVRIP